MNKIVWLLPMLVLCTSIQAQEDNGDEEENPFLDTPPGELRQRIADAPEVLKKDWYQVEAVIFKRQNPVTDEYWRLGREPDLASSVIRLAEEKPNEPELPGQVTDEHRTAAERKAWRTLDEKQFNLESMTRNMLDRGSYRILFHESWRQPISKRNRAFPIYVQGGERIMPPLDSLPEMASTNPEGDRASAPDSNAATEQPAHADTNSSTEDTFLAGHTLAMPEMRGTLLLHVSRYLHVEPDLWLTDQDARDRLYHVQIDQSRRMRSEELHYLDHPKFGLLIQVNPWQSEKQKELERMEEALEAQKDKE